MATSPSDVEEKVLRYERFLNETLRGDLQKVLDERDKIYEQLAEYLQLKNILERLQENKQGKLKTQVDLGCNFYIKAEVPDTSNIFIAIGFGFFLEFTLEEALKFLEKKTTHLNSVADGLTKDGAKIKAHIKFVLEGLREIQQIEDLPETKPQRDLFQ